jgi:hypothetical protein
MATKKKVEAPKDEVVTEVLEQAEEAPQENLVADIPTQEIIATYLNDPKVKENLIQLALSLHHASRGKWETPQEIHKKSEYRGTLPEFKQMVDLLILSKLAFAKFDERTNILKIKITLNKDARKATLIQQIKAMESTLVVLKDELKVIEEFEAQETVESGK